MAKRRRQAVNLSRQQSLDARPVTAPIIDRMPMDTGGERITIEVPTSPWRQRLLRLPGKIQRQFEFDEFGVEVLNLCDGQKPVKYIIERLIRNHELNPHEAERAVTTFLRMLIRKGVVSLYLPKHKA
ncbi:MAG: PqqD family protein [Phycisphaeraceae bacterium]